MWVLRKLEQKTTQRSNNDKIKNEYKGLGPYKGHVPKTKKKPKPFNEAIGRFINGVQDANDDDDDDDIYLKPSTQTQRKKNWT